jgi:membrane-associated protease RseP (regulator of RpoE activity)
MASQREKSMSEAPDETDISVIQQAGFEQLTKLVSSEFQVEVALMDRYSPTYYLRRPQETKQAFLRLLEKLEPMNMIATLRRHERLTYLMVLKIFPKPLVKRSNVLVNWILFFATIATTFATGYLLSLEIIRSVGSVLDPLVGGVSFTVAIMVVLGSHEMGHKMVANRRGVEATPPYFIPGPPPVFGLFGIGTFGAVIFQKSIAANRDSLFDIGSSGPVIGFITATIVTALGSALSSGVPSSEKLGLPPTPLFMLLDGLVFQFHLVPHFPSGRVSLLHPVALAGWVGLLVTMLNLLPVAMLDGGHVARSMVDERLRSVLTVLTVLLLVVKGFWLMSLLVVYLSMLEPATPLDDVSGLSKERKVFTAVLIAIFVLSFPL